MASSKSILPRIVKQLTTPMTSSKRVVSTSHRTDQGLTSVNLDVPACPFQKPMTSINSNDVTTPKDDLSRNVSSSTAKPFSEVPGPKGLPIVGTLFDYFKKDGPKFSKMFEVYQQRAKEYGPVYYEKVGNFDCVVVSDPVEYNKLIRTEGKYPDRREMEPVAFYRTYKGLDLGLVNSQGEEWYNQRTVVSKKMLKLKEISPFSEEMGEVADDFLLNLTDTRDANMEVKGLEQELFKWAMESVGAILFEERIGCLNKQPTETAQAFIHNLEGFFKYLQPLMYNLPFYKYVSYGTWNKFETFTDNILDIGQQMVEKKMLALESGDTNSTSAFLTYLMDKNKSAMNAREITGLVVDLLTAAVETVGALIPHYDGTGPDQVSTASTWSLYCLAKNPRVQERLYQDIEKATPQGGSLTALQLSNLPYVKSILKETLRLYPIVYSTSRHVGHDIEIGGYNIPKGKHVQANLYGMYRDPKLFPDPEEFKPERWLKENKMDATIKATSNLVWGHGARMCVGRRIAEQEIHILLSKIVHNFHLSYNHEDAEPVLNTMMTPDRPIKIQLSPRK